MHLYIPVLALLSLVFALLPGALTAGASMSECSSHRGYCGVTHDRVFTQYRECCPGLSCVAHDHPGYATDVWISVDIAVPDARASAVLDVLELQFGHGMIPPSIAMDFEGNFRR
ncbi:hypothetical protein B0H17DRAFT_1135227 [Mycena rosella]|uniref:Uncharacterized protein n=1 Tax=Mycena rosella TaxID=1033263 RepID=A0AAD7DDN8_MYCRO|nr:hypothetical protein B0H17DRAFT_1135227 [Mycena rosella]